MARYMTTDPIGSTIARDWLADRVRDRMERAGFDVYVSDWRGDGTVEVTLRKRSEDFNPAAWLDEPTAQTVAWIEDTAQPSAEIDFTPDVLRLIDEGIRP